MNLKNCKNCQKEVGYVASECKHCGIKYPLLTKEVKIAYGVLLVVFLLILNSGDDDKQSDTNKKEVYTYNEYAESNLKDFKLLYYKRKKEILNDYFKNSKVDQAHQNNFYKCVSEFAFTKNQNLKLNEIVGWCQNELNTNGKFINTYHNLDHIEDQFSAWDGSHGKLERTILKYINDPDSYDHIETRYRLALNNENPHMFLTTQFRARNGFGGLVINTIKAKADLQTGNILEIVK